MSSQKHPKFKKGSKASLYLELAQPDELGFSRPVSVAEFEGKYESLKSRIKVING